MSRALVAAAVVWPCLVLASCSAPSRRVEPADLVLTGGRVVTLDSAGSEATALAARGGRIVAVGDDQEIGAFVGAATRVVELRGRLAVPGLIEGHGHFAGIGRAARILKLAPLASWQDIVAAVGEAAAEAPARRLDPRPRLAPGEVGAHAGGRGRRASRCTRSCRPPPPRTRCCSYTPAATPRWSNARAMELAGIDRATPDPRGGQILHDAAGEPTGLLRESAAQLVENAYQKALASRPPDQIEADLRRDLEAADLEVLSKGVTTFHDAGETFEEIDRMAAMVERGLLRTRLYVMVRGRPEELAAKLASYRRVGVADGHLTVRTIKVVLDGALGSRGAWLLAPYSDQPGATGLAVTEPATLAQIARLALEHDYQMAVHAIGDRANRETFDVFADVFAGRADAKALRWRIEHAQHLHPDDIPRFAALGVIASMQGIHCTSDAPWVIPRLGEQRAEQGAYVWRKLADSGALVVNGTDAPVEDVDPIPSFDATVTRRLADGTRFFPDQVLSRREALETYTKNSAWAGFEEAEKGTLEPGKRADVTIFDRDLLTIPEEEIRATRVAYTIVGGEVSYQAEAPDARHRPRLRSRSNAPVLVWIGVPRLARFRPCDPAVASARSNWGAVGSGSRRRRELEAREDARIALEQRGWRSSAPASGVDGEREATEDPGLDRWAAEAEMAARPRRQARIPVPQASVSLSTPRSKVRISIVRRVGKADPVDVHARRSRRRDAGVARAERFDRGRSETRLDEEHEVRHADGERAIRSDSDRRSRRSPRSAAGPARAPRGRPRRDDRPCGRSPDRRRSRS